MRSSATSTLLLALVITSASCVGTPQPNPPALDVSRIGTMRSTRLFGVAGALDPDAQLWITPLDTTGDPQIVQPAPDGSFAAPALDGERHRLQPKLEADVEALRGPPVDVLLVDGVMLLGPAIGCWHVPADARAPDARIGEASELVIAIENDCDAPLVVTAATPRRAGDVSVIEAPGEIAPGTSGSLRVAIAPSAEGEREEVVALDVSAPATERRWITVHGVGRR
ncbi:hypothetical protein [Sandaracinus amylolyticus]|uniref:Lipoprotein n=1 Tax=Sandaracinus amylolyticus TaxID=927083 RepID=A0A0F6W0Z4_9BACT|nr:hypothetical protein [Sandaracinus amylolyticus]AKF04477.1 hypothetical protein DB32_001626 [Sandaracinus amylolyticus]